MKLALLGFPIKHSLSPKLYRELLGADLQSYDLLEIEDPRDIPTLEELRKKYDGLSITTPYKSHFFPAVSVGPGPARELGAINTVSFRESGFFGSNTDATAVEKILSRMRNQHGDLSLVILGDGVMARLTILVAQALGLSWEQFSRKKGDRINLLNLSNPPTKQTVVINCCSRSFVFQGELHPDLIFWDYNYAFFPHATTLTARVKQYIDGEEMLRLQALAAIDFWRST